MSPQPMTCREALGTLHDWISGAPMAAEDVNRATAILAALVEEHEARVEYIEIEGSDIMVECSAAYRRTRALERGER